MAWTHLKQTYATQSSTHASSLRLQLHTISKGSCFVTEFFNEVKRILDQLAVIGVKIDDEEYTMHLFCGLNEDYDALTTTILVQNQTTPLNYKTLHDLILAQEGHSQCQRVIAIQPAAFATFSGFFTTRPCLAWCAITHNNLAHTKVLAMGFCPHNPPNKGPNAILNVVITIN